MLRFPPRRILVPFDTTEASLSAWSTARAWARRFKAAVEVLYVEELLPPVSWEFTQQPLTAELKRKILAHIRAKVGPWPRVTISEGDAARVILRRVRASRPDLVIMGTHARQGLARAWIGSVAETVLRLSPAPALVVREGAKARPPRAVLAPVNFTDYSERGLLFAAGVAATFHGRLTALHVAARAERDGAPEFRLRNALARLPRRLRSALRPGFRLRHGRPIVEILEEAKAHDLLVLVAHRQGALRELMFGTTAERVLRYAPASVLTVPAPTARFHWERWLAAAEPTPPLL